MYMAIQEEKNPIQFNSYSMFETHIYRTRENAVSMQFDVTEIFLFLFLRPF